MFFDIVAAGRSDIMSMVGTLPDSRKQNIGSFALRYCPFDRTIGCCRAESVSGGNMKGISEVSCVQRHSSCSWKLNSVEVS